MAGDGQPSLFSTVPHEHRYRAGEVVARRVGASAFGGRARNTDSACEVTLRAHPVALRGLQPYRIDDRLIG